MAQPLSSRLQAGVGLLPPPLPAAPWACLAVGCPLREDDGRTTFRRCSTTGVGRRYSPVVERLRRGSSPPPDPTTPLLVQGLAASSAAWTPTPFCGRDATRRGRGRGPRRCNRGGRSARRAR